MAGTVRAPQSQRWFDFSVNGSQLEKYQLPLNLSEGLRTTAPDERALFHKNMGRAAKIASGYANLVDIDDVRQEAFIALTRAARTYLLLQKKLLFNGAALG